MNSKFVLKSNIYFNISQVCKNVLSELKIKATFLMKLNCLKLFCSGTLLFLDYNDRKHHCHQYIIDYFNRHLAAFVIL